MYKCIERSIFAIAKHERCITGRIAPILHAFAARIICSVFEAYTWISASIQSCQSPRETCREPTHRMQSSNFACLISSYHCRMERWTKCQICFLKYRMQGIHIWTRTKEHDKLASYDTLRCLSCSWPLSSFWQQEDT